VKYRIVEAPRGLDRVFFIQRKIWFWWENLIVNSSVISHKVWREVSYSGQIKAKYGKCGSGYHWNSVGRCIMNNDEDFWFYSLKSAQDCLEDIKTGLEFDRAQEQWEKNALVKNSKKGKRVHEVHVV